MKSINALAKKLTLLEGKKKQVQIGDMKESLRWLALILVQDVEMLESFLDYGHKVEKQEAKKNAKR